MYRPHLVPLPFPLLDVLRVYILLLHRFALSMDDVSYLPAVWYSGSTQTSVRVCSTRREALRPWSCSTANVTDCLSANVVDLTWYLVHCIRKLYIIYIFVYPIYYTLVCIRSCSHVVPWIMLTFPGRWFSYVGNAHGSTRHCCRNCTLGCIAYSRLLYRFSLIRPLSRVLGVQSRRPSSRNRPRPFRHFQLRYFTGKEICRVWGWWGRVEPFETVYSCPDVAVVVVLVCPHFSPILLRWISLMMSSYPFEMIG